MKTYFAVDAEDGIGVRDGRHGKEEGQSCV